MLKKAFLLNLLITTGTISADSVPLQKIPMIHIFGDSHSICISHKTEKSPSNMHFVLHYLGPATMHRVGRDGLNFLNIKNFGVQEGDIAIFTFGEIDARFHILKQRDLQHRTLKEITTTLTQSFITTLIQNKSNFSNITIVVAAVVPPRETCPKLQSYFSGTLKERVTVTKMINYRLQQLCLSHNFLYLDTYTPFALPSGSLNTQISDGCVHIGLEYSYIIHKALFDLLYTHGIKLD